MADDSDAIKALRDAAQADADQAHGARERAELSARAADTAQKFAEQSQTKSAAEAKSAETARLAAEATLAAAVRAQAAAEAAKVAAEDARRTAETARATAEQHATYAQTARDAADRRADAAAQARGFAEASATAAQVAQTAAQAAQAALTPAPAAQPVDPVLEARLKARVDLVQRLFPVAISVGFAAPLTQLHWLPPACPSYDDWTQFVRLLTSILIVIFSWDWYHRDINRTSRPGMIRFVLDVVIVIFYMLLLFTSGNAYAWSIVLAILFLLFVFWDLLTADRRSSFAINVSWLIYFSALAWVFWFKPLPSALLKEKLQSCFDFSLLVFQSAGMLQTVVLCAFSLGGILMIRAEELPILAARRGVVFVGRLVVIVILISLYRIL